MRFPNFVSQPLMLACVLVFLAFVVTTACSLPTNLDIVQKYGRDAAFKMAFNGLFESGLLPRPSSARQQLANRFGSSSSRLSTSSSSDSTLSMFQQQQLQKNSVFANTCEKDECQGPVTVLFLNNDCNKNDPLGYAFSEMVNTEDLKNKGVCVNYTEEDRSFIEWQCDAQWLSVGTYTNPNNIAYPCRDNKPISGKKAAIGHCAAIQFAFLHISILQLCDAKDIDSMPESTPIEVPIWGYLMNPLTAKSCSGDHHQEETKNNLKKENCTAPITRSFYQDKKCQKLYNTDNMMPLFASQTDHRLRNGECYMGLLDNPTLNVEYFCSGDFTGRRLYTSGFCGGTPFIDDYDLRGVCVSLGGDEGSMRVECTP